MVNETRARALRVTTAVVPSRPYVHHASTRCVCAVHVGDARGHYRSYS